MARRRSRADACADRVKFCTTAVEPRLLRTDAAAARVRERKLPRRDDPHDGTCRQRAGSFAVIPSSRCSMDAQGEGLGRAVWQVMRAETPRLFAFAPGQSRERVLPRAVGWSCSKTGRFMVFWYGLDDDFTTIARCVEHRARRQTTLLDTPA